MLAFTNGEGNVIDLPCVSEFCRNTQDYQTDQTGHDTASTTNEGGRGGGINLKVVHSANFSVGFTDTATLHYAAY
jgi:hypothetical protein